MKAPDHIARRSVLDRIIDPGEHNYRTQAESIRAVKSAVLRDVEWLLNTRRIAEPAPDEFEEVQNSIYHYGLADLTQLSPESKEMRSEALRRIADCIEMFEPRLASVRVTEVDAATLIAKGADPEEVKSNRSFRFHIEAVLRIDQMEPVVFDTVLDSLSGRFEVERSY